MTRAELKDEIQYEEERLKYWEQVVRVSGDARVPKRIVATYHEKIAKLKTQLLITP